MKSDSTIPLIDFDRFLNGSDDDRRSVASKIDAAFRSVGFFYLGNHGIAEDKVDECFRWVGPRSFFSECIPPRSFMAFYSIPTFRLLASYSRGSEVFITRSSCIGSHS